MQAYIELDGGAVAEWVRAEGGRVGREGARRRGGRGVDDGNERGRDGTRYGRREG